MSIIPRESTKLVVTIIHRIVTPRCVVATTIHRIITPRCVVVSCMYRLKHFCIITMTKGSVHYNVFTGYI